MINAAQIFSLVTARINTKDEPLGNKKNVVALGGFIIVQKNEHMKFQNRRLTVKILTMKILTMKRML